MSASAHNIEGLTIVEHPLIRIKLSRLREAATPTPEFRDNLAGIATLLAFEATRDFSTDAVRVQTPLAPCSGDVLARPVIIVPILRAGLGMVEGIQSVIPEASVGHIGMFRNETTLMPESYYFKQPAHLADADVLVVDPMLATGHSASTAISQLKDHGALRLRFVCVIGCPEGVSHLRAAHSDVRIFAAAIDGGLNEHAYIVPGLGDAGDRCFGTFSVKPAD
jgi:uracil phosphoribosyltransferase